ncbi:MAG: hypothetical protein GXP26_03770 [Planctomycetes bacterium]|nr:hypothetical protein [Planctomycetota bacterium]
MSTTQTWRSFLTNWPAEFQRRGVLLSVLNETIPFNNFWLQDEMILIERKNPDTSGARFILITFDRIDSVRLIDPVSESAIAKAGFAVNRATATV